MRTPRPICVDFETFGIEGRPDYPPVPAGVSIKEWGKKARYYAWGHMTGNNCSWADAKTALEVAWKTPDGILCHHAKFDLCVAERHFGLKPPPWERIHDTMLLLFLDDPNQREIGLKPADARLLGFQAGERDAVADWLCQHQPVPGVRISPSLKSDTSFMLYLPFAPGGLVGAYAGGGKLRGDTDRTEALFKHLWPSVVMERSMSAAYDRERRLMKVLMAMEDRGVRVNLDRLGAGVRIGDRTLAKIDGFLEKHLRAPGINLNAPKQLIAALVNAGLADSTKFHLTESGQRSAGADSLMNAVQDKALAHLLGYRSEFRTTLNTFMKNWLAVAERSGGLIFTDWYQVRGAGGGARTGRLSSHPNFQNIPTQPTNIDFTKLRGIVAEFLRALPDIPMARQYVAPLERDHVLIDRDFSQQELRVLSHFEGGELMRRYQQDPWVDFHDSAKKDLETIGLFFERTPVKTVNFGLIYGEGVGSLAAKLGRPVEEIKKLKDAILGMYPGLKDMYRDMRSRAEAGLPIRTWGGRESYCEQPAIIKGRIMTFDYKMVNTLVQGSSADATKEAICRYYENSRKADEHLLLNTHDQLTSSVPAKDLKGAMARLRKPMESLEFDVPLLSEGKWSPHNWAALEPYDKKGSIIYKGTH